MRGPRCRKCREAFACGDRGGMEGITARAAASVIQASISDLRDEKKRPGKTTNQLWAPHPTKLSGTVLLRICFLVHPTRLDSRPWDARLGRSHMHGGALLRRRGGQPGGWYEKASSARGGKGRTNSRHVSFPDCDPSLRDVRKTAAYRQASFHAQEHRRNELHPCDQYHSFNLLI